MFRKEFAIVIGNTGMIPAKDLRPLLQNKEPLQISEFELLKFDFFDDIKFSKQVAENYEMTFLDLGNAKIENNILGLLKKSNVIKYRCIPIKKTGKSVSVAIFDPSIVEIKEEIQRIFQHPVEFILTNLGAWEKIFSRLTESFDEIIGSVKEIGSTQEEIKEEEIDEKDIGEDVISYVNKFLAEAFIKKASDIHIEPYEKIFRLRFRIDGSLIEADRPSRKLMLPIISRIKIMATMDISEKRKPQDGRIKLLINEKPIDYRVSSLPTLFGEKIVLRLLDSSNLQLDMTKLGFDSHQLKIFSEGIYQPYGMCLVTGPTGSGKTTTLYSALSDLNKVKSNISTVEDPVEFNLQGINQCNIKKEVGLDFAVALKSFLRQDPDIIMVGEIRDLEVGEIAVEAALTGHLVLSTLHTNDAASTITRLLNMGIEPFLVVGSLNVVVAQRLCRKICDNCKIEDPTSEANLIACGVTKSSAKNRKVFKGQGCDNCNKTGYKGRIAIYEVLNVSPKIKELILKNKSADEIKKQAIREGMVSLRMSALYKAIEGLTTLDEVVTNSGPDKF
ncbi:ATPase, T2SS/T4P/T4SS family [Bacteriovoracales bacterium]|nr:ATPase, T2SS/T4P/T4SS family [Bacteriovoracales bacterium]